MKIIFLLLSLSVLLLADIYRGKLVDAKCSTNLDDGIHTCYSIKNKGPNFVEYTLNGKFHNYKRQKFTYDPEIYKAFQANPNDYVKSGYDRGHLMSKKSASSSKKLCIRSFEMTNVAPQRPYFNRYVWEKVEDVERKFSTIYGKVDVVSGVIYSKKELKQGSVHLPLFWYKIIHIRTKNITLYYLFPAEYKYKTNLEFVLFRVNKKILLYAINRYSNISLREKYHGRMNGSF